MEKELQTIPTEKDFNLSKVKLLPKGGIQAEYQVTQIVDGETSLIDRNETCTRDVHPDLLAMFADLRTIVARVFNITSFLTLLESDEMKLPESKKMLARNFADELLSKIEVRGVAWSGTGDNTGVVITSVFETPNGLKTCINTPRIKMATISFGFEEELETIVESIKKEVYAYLFKGKQAQMSLFGDNGAADDEPDPLDAPDDMPGE
jgi:hypothetical protein